MSPCKSIAYRSCLLLLIVGGNVVLSSSDYDYHRYNTNDGVVSRNAADKRPYDSILSKFDVHRDSIILTMESKSMGAKYINETETASNEECLLWCWKHRDCNVAVFEEVMRRSCFIFNCGPPADFRCKFTTHNFYSSSFLKMSQHLYDLKEWSKEAKQEQEAEEKKALTQIVTSTSTPAATTMTVTAVNTPITAVSTTSIGQTKGILEAPKCRHYQFQCVNNSECIAIYNVCDGIPQCPDGSDESAELRCQLKGTPKFVTPQKMPESVEHVPQTLPVNAIVNPSPPQISPPVQAPQQQKEQVTHQTVHITQVLTPPPLPPPPQVHARPNIPVQNRHQAHQHHITSDNEQIPQRGMADEAAMYREGYKSPKSQQGLYFDAASDDSLHSPFSHRHSKFMAANDPRIQYPSRWAEDYERYQMKASPSDQRYGSYDSTYPRVSDSFSKSQYPDYDRTVYDTYHPEDNPAYPEQDQLPSSSYISSDYPQPNMPAVGPQPSYSSREEPYEGQRIQQKPMRNDEYIPINRPIIKQVHKSHVLHEPKPVISDQDMLGQEDLRSQPFIQYADMPRTNYRIEMSEIKAPDISIPSSRIAADMSHMYERDEAIRKSLSQQLQALHKEPMHMSDHLLISPGHTPNPAMIKPKANVHLVPAPSHENNPSGGKPLNTESMDHHPEQKNHHKLHNAAPPTAANSISAKKLSTGTKTPHVQVTRAPESSNTVIVIAMGLIITAVFVVLVACRLRTLRRKTIRRGRNLTHDADYLVNGLYL